MRNRDDPTAISCSRPAPEFTGSSKPDLLDPVVRTEPGWYSDHTAQPSWSCGKVLTTGPHLHAGPDEHVDFDLE